MAENKEEFETYLLLTQLKQLKDWNRYPLPEVLYKKYNIEKPMPAESVAEFVKDFYMGQNSSWYYKAEEVRPPAEGGVRKLNPLILVDGTPYEPTIQTASEGPKGYAEQFSYEVKELAPKVETPKTSSEEHDSHLQDISQGK